MKKSPAVNRNRLQVVMKFASALAVFLLVALSGCGDSKQNDLIVPDFGNNRVLIYTAPFTTGQSATTVLGQPDFTAVTAGTTASKMNKPEAVALDASGNLYVLEHGSGNGRLLQFKPPFTTGMSASLVLGASDFTTTGSIQAGGVAVDKNGNVFLANSPGGQIVEYAAPLSNGMAATMSSTASMLSSPVGITFDKAGNLWITENGRNRVLEFTPPFSATMTPTVILGQPDSTSTGPNTGGISSATLSSPLGLVFDDDGNLWVADQGNNRTVRYKAPFTNGKAADVVIGQTSFTSSVTSTPSASSLNMPQGVDFVNGKLVVGDSANNRTLVYSAPFTNGMNASAVLGQSSFTQNSANGSSGTPSAATQSNPYGAGPSWIALGVLAALIAAWYGYSRHKANLSTKA